MDPALSSPWEPWMVGLAITLAATPVATFVGRRFDLVDSTDSDASGRPMPRSGGLAIAAGWVGTCLLLGVGDLAVGVAAAAGAAAIGLHDDFKKSSAKLRLLLLAGLAVAVAAAGVRVEEVVFPGTSSTLALGPAAIPLSALWILGVTVAFDFIDGLDGLAAGLAVVAGMGVVVVSMPFAAGQPVEVAALALCASATGFLFFNRPPASIYMGDNGSNLLGFAVGLITLKGTAPGASFAVVPALLLVAIPVFDAARTMVRRARSDGSLFASDEGHIHHRMLGGGLSPVAILGLLLGAASILAVVGIAVV